MKLTKSFEQGVAIMAIIATQSSGQPVSSRTLQTLIDASPTYSQKILRRLVVANLITSTPGANGGFQLARPTTEISALDVIEALEGRVDSFPNQGLLSAVFSNPNHQSINADSADNAIHRVFMAADNAWCAVMDSVTLADIINKVVNSGLASHTVDWNDWTNQQNQKGE